MSALQLDIQQGTKQSQQIISFLLNTLPALALTSHCDAAKKLTRHFD